MCLHKSQFLLITPQAAHSADIKLHFPSIHCALTLIYTSLRDFPKPLLPDQHPQDGENVTPATLLTL